MAWLLAKGNPPSASVRMKKKMIEENTKVSFINNFLAGEINLLSIIRIWHDNWWRDNKTEKLLKFQEKLKIRIFGMTFSLPTAFLKWVFQAEIHLCYVPHRLPFVLQLSRLLPRFDPWSHFFSHFHTTILFKLFV